MLHTVVVIIVFLIIVVYTGSSINHNYVSKV